jgi:hypothetical protein
MNRLGCRMGLHKWVRYEREDADLENPSRSIEWFSKCRYCGREQGSGTVVSLYLCGPAVLAAVAVFWLLSPLLGVVLMIGALGGLMWAMGPAAIGRVARWLSIGR